MLTLESALAMFIMLAISSVSLIFAQRAKLPHSVVLVGIGIILGGLTFLPEFSFMTTFSFTPELLFYIFLPTLIFESAFNIKIRKLTKDAPIISILAMVSLIISAFVIALGLSLVFSFFNLEIPFIFSLLFGSIVSATDPVAVLALFKEYVAPTRLSLIFEGESIFNDGTGVALFLVVLTIAETGLYGITHIAGGALSFTLMVVGGVVFGLIMGGIFAKLIGLTRSNESASITLTLVLAHLTFIFADLISQHTFVAGHPVLISPIIATAIASLLIGNYGRYKLPAHATEFVEKFWGQFAFLANSLIFVLIGMLAIQLPLEAKAFVPVIIAAVIVVAIARAISIYPVVYSYNAFAEITKKVPLAWQHVLAWGSLRGALAITMVLLIPDTLTFPGWALSLTPKEFILTLTISSIFASLFIKATTIGYLMRRLRLDVLTPFETLNFREMIIYVNNVTLKKIKSAFDKGYVSKDAFMLLKQEQKNRIETALRDMEAHAEDSDLLRIVIKLHAIGIERKYVHELFSYGEVTEDVIRRIISKLDFQTQIIERGGVESAEYEIGRSQDVFEYLALRLRILRRGEPTEHEIVRSKYLYYRALSILSRKVIKELTQLDEAFASDYALPHDIIKETIGIYTQYREGSITKMQALRDETPKLVDSLDESLARLSLYKGETQLLAKLRERSMVTTKVSIALAEHFEEDNKEVARS